MLLVICYRDVGYRTIDIFELGRVFRLALFPCFLGSPLAWFLNLAFARGRLRHGIHPWSARQGWKTKFVVVGRVGLVAAFGALVDEVHREFESKLGSRHRSKVERGCLGDRIVAGVT